MTAALCPVCGSTSVERYPTPYPDPLVRCRACGARFVHPPPTEAAMRVRYEREHGAGKWRTLFEAADPREPVRRALLLAGLTDAGAHGRRLLDVGCGDGSFLDAADAAGWRVVGLELSFAAARSVAGRHPVLVGPISALSDGPRFGAITFWDVLEHLPDPATAVRAAVKLLEAGGLIAASMPNASGTEALVNGRSWRYHDVEAYGHLVHLGPAQLERIFHDAGLAPVHVETRGSTDLRSLVGEAVGAPLLRPLVWALDHASGVLARVAQSMGRGNTLLVVGRLAPGAPR